VENVRRAGKATDDNLAFANCMLYVLRRIFGPRRDEVTG